MVSAVAQSRDTVVSHHCFTKLGMTAFLGLGVKGKCSVAIMMSTC